MVCRELVEVASDYREGALDPEQALWLELHLLTCTGCVTYLDHIDATVKLLGRVGHEELSPATRSRLLAALDA